MLASIHRDFELFRVMVVVVVRYEREIEKWRELLGSTVVEID